MKSSLVLFQLLIPLSLFAEIEMVQIHWNALKCQSTCVAQIEQNLKTIPAVSNIQIDGPSGLATMNWKPNEPFSYDPFRYAAAAVGITIREMRVKVLGKITHEANNLYLVSIRDGTRFQLIGPIYTEPGRYAPKYNMDSHPLSPTVREELLAAERKDEDVQIEGPLYLPSHWPRVLITEQIKVNPQKS